VPLRITTVPLPAEGSKLAARQGRGRSTCGLTRCGSVSGEASAGEDQHSAMGARVGPRGGLGWVGRRRKLAGVRARRGGGGNGESTGSGAHAREEMGRPFIADTRAQGILLCG
jgi:hypothetical protein